MSEIVQEDSDIEPSSTEQFEIFGWKGNQDEEEILGIVFFALIITIIRIFYQGTKIQQFVPNSILLTILGIITSIIFCAADWRFGIKLFDFPYEVYLYIFIPIIIFETTYNLNTKLFFDNIIEILVYSIVGTLLAAAIIGGLLCASNNLFNAGMTIEDYFSFASIISAVDPVAVVSIMQSLHINSNLLLLTIGESTVNDAISLTLFDVCKGLTSLIETDNAGQIFGLAIAKFFVSMIMSLLLGSIITFSLCYIIKFSQKLQNVQSLICLLCAYACFILSDSLDFSGVLACMTSAMISVRYCQHAMSKDQRHILSEVLEVLSNTLESILYFDMGIEIIDIFWHDEIIDWYFAFLPIVYTFVARLIAVPLQTVFLNMKRKHTGKVINWKEQLCLIWCGLRGGIAFSTASSWNLGNRLQERQIILSTSVLVLFTTVFYGLTMKPIIQGLNIKRQQNQTIYAELLTQPTTNIKRFAQSVIGSSNLFEFYLKELDNKLQKVFLPEGTEIDRELVQQVAHIMEKAVAQQKQREEEEEKLQKMKEFKEKYGRARFMSYDGSILGRSSQEFENGKINNQSVGFSELDNNTTSLQKQNSLSTTDENEEIKLLGDYQQIV